MKSLKFLATASLATALLAMAPAGVPAGQAFNLDPVGFSTGPLTVDGGDSILIGLLLPAVQNVVSDARVIVMAGDGSVLVARKLVPGDGSVRPHAHYFKAEVVTIQDRRQLRVTESGVGSIYEGAVPPFGQVSLLYVEAQDKGRRNWGDLGRSIQMFGDGSVRPIALKSFEPVDSKSIIGVLVGL